MIAAGCVLLMLALLLRTRLGRLKLALLLLKAGNSLSEAGSRCLDNVKREMGN